MERPEINFVERERNESVHSELVGMGYNEIGANIIARRNIIGGDAVKFIEASLKDLDHPEGLNDIELASERIAQAIQNQDVIGVVSDYDNDGIASMTILSTSLVELFGLESDKMVPFIGERLTEGYGLSDGLCQRILDHDVKPSLIITADCGSSDEARIQLLKEAGIDVIVSDHHKFPDPEGPPASAYAVVSPIHPDGSYPDETICGAMVSWLLMVMTRKTLIANGSPSLEGVNMGMLLDYCATATVADCVSMASVNNRAVVKHGLHRMSGRTRPAWEAFCSAINSESLNVEDLSFGLCHQCFRTTYERI